MAAKPQLPKKRLEGWMKIKTAEKVFGKHKWAKRFACLDPEMFNLCLYVTEQDQFMQDVAEEINLQHLRSVKIPADKQGRLDIVQYDGKEFSLQIDNDADLKKWFSYVQPFKEVVQRPKSVIDTSTSQNADHDPAEEDDQFDESSVSMSRSGVSAIFEQPQTRPYAQSIGSAAFGGGGSFDKAAAGGAPKVATDPSLSDAPPMTRPTARSYVPEMKSSSGNLPPLPATQQNKAPTVNVAIIGTGWGGRVQIPAFQKARLNVVALWGRSLEKAEELAKAFNVPLATDDFSKIVDNPDVHLIVVTTPPHLHAKFVLEALEKGKHVVCEKPAGASVPDVLQMASVAQGKPSQLTVIDHELRHLPGVVRFRNYILAGRLGRLLHASAVITTGSRLHDRAFNWWSQKDAGGGVLGAIGSHLIDILSYIMGSRVQRVSGIMQTCIKQRHEDSTGEMKPVTSDDHTVAEMLHKNGVYSSLNVSVVTAGDSEHKISVSGTAGTLMLRQNRLVFYPAMSRKAVILMEDKLIDDAGLNSVWGTGSYYLGCALNDVLTKLSAEADDRKKQDLINEFVKNVSFKDGDADDSEDDKPSGPLKVTEAQLKGYTPTAASMQDGLYVQRVMDAIEQSHQRGSWVIVE